MARSRALTHFRLSPHETHEFNAPKRSGVDVTAAREVVSRLHGLTRTIPLLAVMMNPAAALDSSSFATTAEGLRFTPHGLRAVCEHVKLRATDVIGVGSTDPELAARLLNNRIKYAATSPGLKAVVVDGRVDGVVTNLYQRIPNLEIFDRLSAHSDIVGGSALISSFSQEGSTMRMTTYYRDTEREMKPGDVCGCGSELLNAENGTRAFRLRAYVLRLACMNGATFRTAQSTAHIRHTVGAFDEGIAYLDNASLRSPEVLERIAKSLHRPLLKEDLTKAIAMLGKDGFGTVAVNRILKAAQLDATRDGRALMLYDLWNGITAEAHLHDDLDMIVTIQGVAEGYLDYFLKTP